MASDILMTTSPCHQFEEEFEFYSPGYPQPYPNNTECIRLLEGILLRVFKMHFGYIKNIY